MNFWEYLHENEHVGKAVVVCVFILLLVALFFGSTIIHSAVTKDCVPRNLPAETSK